MAVTVALLLLALHGTSCTSNSTSSSTSSAAPASLKPAPWSGEAVPRKPGTIRLGNLKHPSWGWADVPVEVVQQAQARLKPPASSWDVSHHWHDDGNTFEVVHLEDDNSKPCLFICTQGKWMLMEGAKGLRQSSLMEQERLRKLPHLSPAHLKRLCGDIAYLGARSGGYVLHADMRNEELSVRPWLGGEVKDAGVLKKYCVDPEVIQEGAELVITWYATTRKGSLEQWTTRVRRLDDGRSEIVDITIREVLKKGSFRWALVP
jgi:hypothetical protein